MDAETADKVVRGFLTQPGIRAWAQGTLAGEWDVWVQAPRHRRRIFNTRASAQAFWRHLVAEGVIVR